MPKDWVKKRPYWDDELVEELAQEAWKNITQKWINDKVDSMPQRLRDVINSDGQMAER